MIYQYHISTLIAELILRNKNICNGGNNMGSHKEAGIM